MRIDQIVLLTIHTFRFAITQSVTQNLQKKLIFISTLSPIHLDPPYALSCRGLRTQLWTLPCLCTHSYRASIHYPNPWLRLTDASKHSFSKTHYTSNPIFHTKKLAPSTHRASLYLYLSMDHDPWAGQLNLYLFTLFLGGIHFDST